jgi:GWxTD domain-containing protein
MNLSALSGALAHFLWQGALIALVLTLVLRLSSFVRLRYAMACVALFLMPVAVGITYFMQAGGAREGIDWPVTVLRLERAPEWAASAAAAAEPRSPAALNWMVLAWMTGVALFYAYRLGGWIRVQHYRRVGVCAPPPHWQERLQLLLRRVRCSRAVVLLESTLADTPVTLGFLRPVILMPVGVLAGLPAEQVEAILLHELAHVRRYDYLVNLLQGLVEGLLFYHPAVWWVSHVIRGEREVCCDEIAAKACGDAPALAQALAALEHRRILRREPVLAATGGSLMHRIQRLLGKPTAPRPVVAPAIGLLLIAGCAALVAWQPTPKPAPAPAPQVQAVQPAPAPAARPTRAPGRSVLAQAQTSPAIVAPADNPYQRWLDEEVIWIITPEERAAFARLRSDDERQQFIEQFWLRRDPTPATQQNELREEHYRRIAWANDRFSTDRIPGWKTDRGMVYIQFGTPDEHAVYGPESGTYPYERWVYQFIQGVGQVVIVEFVDRTGNGEYRLAVSPDEKSALMRFPGTGQQLMYR